jgi:ATPase, P-type (transporting), HAD superfamily, subfamily IC
MDEVRFASALKWSALALDDGVVKGAYVLGAPEMIAPHLRPGVELGEQLHIWAAQGLRVLLLARQPDTLNLHNTAGEPILPDDLDALGLICFRDELRPEARETLERFAKTGIRLKIISGDNPHTVASLAKQAGFPKDIRAVSGVELACMDETEFARVADEATVFGRITPQQKEMLVNALRSRGYYVAMIGDGVNDVLSLKKADIGIAMNSGSQATRGVADIVLLNDSFAALPPAFLEGQRIVNGMQDIVRLFLVRVFYMALIILGGGCDWIGLPVFADQFVAAHTFDSRHTGVLPSCLGAPCSTAG